MHRPSNAFIHAFIKAWSDFMKLSEKISSENRTLKLKHLLELII